jgi:spermidine synthase
VVSDARGVRTLHIGGEAVQSAMRINAPDALELDYTRCMMAALLFQPRPRKALLIGLGGGSLAKFLHRRMKSVKVRAVEVDPRVVAVAQAQFALPPEDARLRIEIGDGARALAPACCDLLIVDAFDDEQPDARFLREDFHAEARAALSSGGVMVLNLMSDDPQLDSRLRTIEHVFRGAVLPMPALTDPNLIIIALKDPPPAIPWATLRERARKLRAQYGLPFPRYVNALRRMNRHSSREILVGAAEWS